MKTVNKYFCLSVACALLVGCSKPNSENIANNTAAKPEVTKAAPAIVSVNGEPITKAEVEYQLSKILGDQAALFYSEELEAKVLESMVSSRAMASEMLKTLSAEEKEQFELQVKAYREEILVNRFIQENIETQPVPLAMVKDYYEQNPEDFGGALEKTFEYITTHGALTEQQRDQVIVTLSNLTIDADWKTAAQQLAEAGIPITHKSAKLAPELVAQPLQNLLKKTPAGQLSSLSTGETLMRVKVISEFKRPAKSLTEVSADIRKKLAPIVMKESIRALSEKVRATAEIKRLDDSSQG